MFCLTTFVILLAASFTAFNTVEAGGTRVFVYDPKWETIISSAEINATFTIEIKVADVDSLVGWQFFLRWNSAILEVVGVAEGSFLNKSGSYPSDFGPVRKPGDANWEYNDTVFACDALVNPSQTMAATGSGVLATVTFRVKAEGTTTLHFRQDDPNVSKLIGWSAPGMGLPPKIPHTTEDGYFILPGPQVFVDPDKVLRPDFLAGASFDVNVSLTSVSNLYNWTLGFSWDPAVLYVNGVAEGPLLSDKGATEFRQSINNTGGFLNMSNRLLNVPLGGVNGSGTLATVSFLVEAKGESKLNIYDTWLFKSDGGIILHVHKDGFFSNVNHDVEVTSVDVLTTSVKVGDSVTITATVKNLGEVEENFDVTVYYGDKTVGTSAVAGLVPDDSDTVEVTWYTTGIAPGVYTISARASQVPGEVNLDNNFKEASSKVTVTGQQADYSMYLIIGGVVAVVAIVGIGVFLLYRRRK